MDFERMWNQLKSDIKMQEELSNEIDINKLLARIKQIEDVEKQAELRWENGELPF